MYGRTSSEDPRYSMIPSDARRSTSSRDTAVRFSASRNPSKAQRASGCVGVRTIGLARTTRENRSRQSHLQYAPPRLDRTAERTGLSVSQRQLLPQYVLAQPRLATSVA